MTCCLQVLRPHGVEQPPGAVLPAARAEGAAAAGGVGEHVLLNPEGKVATSMVVEAASF